MKNKRILVLGIALVLLALIVGVAFATTWEECDSCNGSGTQSCSTCDGTGKHPICSTCNGTGYIGYLDCGPCDTRGYFPCVRCSGTGELRCGSCNGQGGYYR